MSDFTLAPRLGLERALRITVRVGFLLFRISRCIVTATGLGIGFAIVAIGGLMCIMMAVQPDYITGSRFRRRCARFTRMKACR